MKKECVEVVVSIEARGRHLMADTVIPHQSGEICIA